MGCRLKITIVLEAKDEVIKQFFISPIAHVKMLQPDNDSLQVLDDAIDDKDQIYDVMSGKSDFVCGMATVILSIMRLNAPSSVPDFPEDFKAQFLGFGRKGVAVDRENTALVFNKQR
jgi:hypothetical protein